VLFVIVLYNDSNGGESVYFMVTVLDDRGIVVRFSVETLDCGLNQRVFAVDTEEIFPLGGKAAVT
jgi:hypothetical protein